MQRLFWLYRVGKMFVQASRAYVPFPKLIGCMLSFGGQQIELRCLGSCILPRILTGD